ncbi:heme exporter protein CcmB [Aliifodinibius salicampi]|uniref:Heme exporter protein CcmB n=1 Tax=Fodinibius salicampi TaxID=1920655 RepID=A0ABT3PUP3_9BACT|nr:heme exporter protein CcmB [Fodinibius salicampi]MCW9711548.1 heme exporter protein CcmB [Fodinibius salicampi]
MNFIRGITAILLKDVQTELRSRYAFNTVLAFVGAALLLILFALKAEQLPAEPQSALVWIVILFAGLSSLSRSFVMETDKQTFNLLRLHGKASNVYLGKLCFNYLFTFTVNLVTFTVYIFLLGISVADHWALISVLVFGTAGLSSVATMLAAIVSQADRKGAIFSVLSLPLLFPLILILVQLTKAALIENIDQNFLNDFWALIGYVGTTITAGILLFDYIWDD